MSSGSLPNPLKAALATRLEGVSRSRIAEHAARLSQAYRAGGPSSSAVTMRSDLDAYLAARMPATFAAIHRALDHTFAAIGHDKSGTGITSLIDAGCGPGTAAHAALDHMPGLEEITLIDGHAEFLRLARELGKAAGCPAIANARAVHADLTRTSGPAAKADPGADLVIAGYVLAEMSEDAAARLAVRLYGMTRKVLLIVEPGTTAGFSRILAARKALRALGAQCVAPCPGNVDCPIVSPDWCHFKIRLQRSRDHMRIKGAGVPYEDEPFSFLAVVKDPAMAPGSPAARILKPVIDAKPGKTLTLCTTHGAVEKFVPARDKEKMRAIKRLEWGDPFILS